MQQTACVPGRLEAPRITRILAVRKETERHVTITFKDDLLGQAEPGTFCMVWVPGVDENPMGLGYNDADGNVTLTIEAKGDATRALAILGVSGKIGLRGPYGQGFRIPANKGHVVFVGGGTGIAPMARGIQSALAAGHKVTLVSGARNKDLMLLHTHLSGIKDKNFHYAPCTDDGTFGFHGFTTQKLEQLLHAGGVDYVAACGPEKMMHKVTAICDKAGVASEASLERYMKCSTGICDACTVGPGWRVCLEGPVFTSKELKQIPEYGTGHRDAAGILHPW